MARKDEDKKDLEEQCPPCPDIVLLWPGAQLQFKSCQGKEMGGEGRDGPGDRVDPAREEGISHHQLGHNSAECWEVWGARRQRLGWSLQGASCRPHCS